MSKANVEKVAQQIKVLEARLQRERALEKQRLRRLETHQKIILGSWVLAKVGRDLEKLTPELRAELDRFVMRPHDRRALGLPIHEKPPRHDPTAS